MRTRNHEVDGLEQTLLVCCVVITVATLTLALLWPQRWIPLSKEDTGPEAATVLALGLLTAIAIWRALRAPAGARLPHFLLAALALAAAGEEVSWGQRFFAFEAPRFFAEHNAQAETNLHNLIPPPFDFVAALILLAAFAAAPALATRPWTRALIRRGWPWPRRRHVAVFFGCALPAGVLAAVGIDGLEELVELVAVLVASAVVVASPAAPGAAELRSRDSPPSVHDSQSTEPLERPADMERP
jgi:hypothetical protein